jgi:hypothetical protein
MSNVVQFLEALARNPKSLTTEEFAIAVANAELDPAAREALLRGDTMALNQAVGGRATVMCFVVPAENDEPQEGEEEQEESPEREASSRAA